MKEATLMLSLPAPPLTVEESKEAVAVITSLSALPLTNELAVNEAAVMLSTPSVAPSANEPVELPP